MSAEKVSQQGTVSEFFGNALRMMLEGDTNVVSLKVPVLMKDDSVAVCEFTMTLENIADGLESVLPASELH